MRRSMSLFVLLITTGCATPQDASVQALEGDVYSWLDDSDVDFDAPIPDDAAYHPSRVIVGFFGNDRPEALQQAGVQLERLRPFDNLPAAVYTIAAGQDVLDCAVLQGPDLCRDRQWQELAIDGDTGAGCPQPRLFQQTNRKSRMEGQLSRQQHPDGPAG